MSRVDELSCEFVTRIPDKLAAGTLYVSMEYATAIHLCCCGCGNEVVTPLSPTDWRLTYDGEGISLHPSIGNWSFKCRSHYWIHSSQVQWAGPMSDAQVRAVRMHDMEAKAAYFDPPVAPPSRGIGTRYQCISSKLRLIWQRALTWLGW